MNYSSIARNTMIAFAAQFISLSVSVVMSLLVPKIVGVADYGYWQLFMFYTTYSGFFHLGLNDGVYLINGGLSRDEIDKSSIKSQYIFGACFQAVICLGITFVSLPLVDDANRVFVIASFALYTVVYNLTSYLGFVFQAMNETKLFSFSTMLDRLVFLAPLLVLIGFKVSDYHPYVYAYLVSKIIALIYCSWMGRDILCAKSASFGNSLKDGIRSIIVGVKLMIANIADTLILGVSRFLIDHFWGIVAFAKISFSLSLVNFFITFVSQASMVLFPALRTGSDEERVRFYIGIRNAIELIFPAIFLFYFPMVWFLGAWLPQYAESLRYFALLLPICVFNTKMSLCCTTYFKVLRKEQLLLKLNIVTVICSAVFSIFGVLVLNSLDAVLCGAVICIIGRSLWSELYLNEQLSAPGSTRPFQEILLTAAFVLFTELLSGGTAAILYALVYVGYLLLNHSALKSVASCLTKLKKQR